MSAWFIFSALGFYPVNPVSGQYVVGSPFFEKVTLTLHPPAASSPATLTIRAPGVRTKPYIKSLTINGVPVVSPTIAHAQIAHGGEVVFEMSDTVEAWGNTEEVVKEFGVSVGGGEGEASVKPSRRTHGW
ncbi:hypothetical protein D9619_012814 [Psilocybe cf. subviscida]|uniref:Glycosyl hydrolase family 92 domain-containing protein n=1 Tax=Psilocybe cf. subviscida TaxID=2480587 RepID=A0A8H5ER13_9AGAR|nr:hypothetical protein D9619_012814 [Psilocybe cf. subviscida]